MVARNTDADVRQERPQEGAVQRFLRWWQQSLSILVNTSQKAASPAVNRMSEKAKGGPRSVLALRSPALTWIGGLALLVGAVGTVVLSAANAMRPVAIAAAGMSLVWGALRLILLRVGATNRLRKDPLGIRGAWALGSIAWVVAVTPELRALAWAVSGAVTWLVIERLGATRRQASICVGIAWGAQAFVAVGSWLASNAVVAILASRG